MSVNISNYLARITELEQAALSGSVAYPVMNIGTARYPHWTNQLQAVNPTFGSYETLAYSITVRARLMRGGIDEGYDQTLETTIQGDVFTVLSYFITENAKNLITPTYTTPQAGYVPQSLTITSEGVTRFETDAGLLIGSVYVLNFSHHERRT